MNDQHPAIAEVAKLIEENKRLRMALAAIEAVLTKPTIPAPDQKGGLQ
jgi:hypothetical protein